MVDRLCSRMFNIVTSTWNPVTGCRHGCRYCWARRIVYTRLISSRKYRYGFVPTLHMDELDRVFRDGELVFVCDMGDLFGSWIPNRWIEIVLNHIQRFQNTQFLLMTKNPSRYIEVYRHIPGNCILGVTIETNRDDIALSVSRAPPPTARARAMIDLKWSRKLVSVEPIMDFDPEVLEMWIRDIDPELVYIGYDNYYNNLQEPPISKTEDLIRSLERFTNVVRKTIRPAWYEKQYLASGK